MSTLCYHYTFCLGMANVVNKPVPIIGCAKCASLDQNAL